MDTLSNLDRWEPRRITINVTLSDFSLGSSRFVYTVLEFKCQRLSIVGNSHVVI